MRFSAAPAGSLPIYRSEGKANTVSGGDWHGVKQPLICRHRIHHRRGMLTPRRYTPEDAAARGAIAGLMAGRTAADVCSHTGLSPRKLYASCLMQPSPGPPPLVPPCLPPSWLDQLLVCGQNVRDDISIH